MDNLNENAEVETASDGATPEQEVDYKALYESEKANAEKWKALSRKNEAAYKESSARLQSNGDSESKLAEVEERAAKAEKEVAALRRENNIAKVAEEYGIPSDLVYGDTVDDMRANADKWKKHIDSLPIHAVVHGKSEPEPSAGPVEIPKFF